MVICKAKLREYMEFDICFGEFLGTFFHPLSQRLCYGDASLRGVLADEIFNIR